MSRRSPIPPGTDPQEHPALKGGHVVILAGEKPIYKQHASGPQGHAALGHVLEQKGFDYEPVHGKYNGDKQPGYIVHARDDNEVETLKGIAKRMGQEAIVHSVGGKHQYVYTAGDNEGMATPPESGVNWFGDAEPDDNFTTLYGPSGEPLGHFSYNINFDAPLVPHGKGPMTPVPEAAQQVLKSAVEAYRGILLDLRKRETDKLAQHTCRCKKNSRGECACTKKYEVEAKRTMTHGPKPVSDDISAQGFAGKGTNPNPHNIAQGGPISPNQPGKTRKSEAEDRRAAAAVRDADDAQLARIPLRPASAGPREPTPQHVPSIAEQRDTKKTEKSMTLHDLMKAQASGSLQPLEKPPVSEAQRRLVHARANAGEAWAKEWAAADKPGKLPEHKKTEVVAEADGVRISVDTKKAEYHPTPSYTSARDVSSPHSDGSSLSPNKPSHPFSDPARATTGGSMNKAQCTCGLKDCKWCGTRKSEESPKDTSHGPYYPVVKNSIFKKAPEMGKAETNASMSAHRNGGTIKLGKQEFYIDLANASDPKKRVRETNPVKESVVPGGKETGWDSNGPKPKTVERSASGGAISANKPKAGPDQKNTAENSIVEGALKPKAAPKNDLIEKAAAAWHKRNPNGGLVKGTLESKLGTGKVDHLQAGTAPGTNTPMAPKPPMGAMGKAETPGQGEHPGQGRPAIPVPQRPSGPMTRKAQTSMAAPATPKAPGAGSPTLSPKAPVKPPMAAPGGKPMGKALMPFGAQAGGAQAAIAGQKPAAGAPAAAPKATPQPTSAYDPSLYQPKAPVHSGLFTGAELHQPPPGTGVTPKPAPKLTSPAQHKGIRGFMGKAEMCKSCGKMHPVGKCQ